MEGLCAFVDAVKNDNRVKPTHISLYAVLALLCNAGNALDFTLVPRGRLLQYAKISETTFHRCMRELHAFGYIRYLRSYDPRKKSKLILLYGDLVCTDGR